MDFIQSEGQQPPDPKQQAAATNAANTVAEMIPQGQPMPQEPVGGGLSAVEPSPEDYPEEAASPEEQKQYEDLFIRVMAAVHDIRKPPKGRNSLADQVLQMLSNKDAEPAVNIGRAAGTIMIGMITMAKRQKQEYAPDVIREVGMDLVGELYRIAQKSGAIRNLPKEDSKGYEYIIQFAMAEATKTYGENLIASGQTNQQEHMKELQHQMQREADAGELDDWGMEEFDDESRHQLVRRMGDITNGS